MISLVRMALFVSIGGSLVDAFVVRDNDLFVQMSGQTQSLSMEHSIDGTDAQTHIDAQVEQTNTSAQKPVVYEYDMLECNKALENQKTSTKFCVEIFDPNKWAKDIKKHVLKAAVNAGRTAAAAAAAATEAAQRRYISWRQGNATAAGGAGGPAAAASAADDEWIENWFVIQESLQCSCSRDELLVTYCEGIQENAKGGSDPFQSAIGALEKFAPLATPVCQHKLQRERDKKSHDLASMAWISKSNMEMKLALGGEHVLSKFFTPEFNSEEIRTNCKDKDGVERLKRNCLLSDILRKVRQWQPAAQLTMGAIAQGNGKLHAAGQKVLHGVRIGKKKKRAAVPPPKPPRGGPVVPPPPPPQPPPDPPTRPAAHPTPHGGSEKPAGSPLTNADAFAAAAAARANRVAAGKSKITDSPNTPGRDSSPSSPSSHSSPMAEAAVAAARARQQRLDAGGKQNMHETPSTPSSSQSSPMAEAAVAAARARKKRLDAGGKKKVREPSTPKAPKEPTTMFTSTPEDKSTIDKMLGRVAQNSPRAQNSPNGKPSPNADILALRTKMGYNNEEEDDAEDDNAGTDPSEW